MHPLDPYRAAWLLIQQHGPDAALHASERAMALRAVGDTEGDRVWREIEAAVKVLERREPKDGERWQ